MISVHGRTLLALVVGIVLTSSYAVTTSAQSTQTAADRQRQMRKLQQRQPQGQQPQGQRASIPKDLPQGRSAHPANATANQRPNSTNRAARQPSRPFELTDEQEKHLHQTLDYWEFRSGKVKTYSCDFMRHDYDHVFGPKNPYWPKTRCQGSIRFASPDKGEFRVNNLGKFTPPKEEGEQPTWPMKKVEESEHWICNGKAVFELNAKRKLLIERQLPEEMQGKQIADGPLPFMFGAKKEKLLERYWIRELVPPKGNEGQFWVEAYPRLAETAAEFQRVRVILDGDTFLPNAIEVYPTTYNPRTNPSRTVYVFTDRLVNDPIHRARDFLGGFISPKTPLGWKKIVESFNEPAPDPGVARTPTKTAQPAARRTTPR